MTYSEPYFSVISSRFATVFVTFIMFMVKIGNSSKKSQFFAKKRNFWYYLIFELDSKVGLNITTRTVLSQSNLQHRRCFSVYNISQVSCRSRSFSRHAECPLSNNLVNSIFWWYSLDPLPCASARSVRLNCWF